MKRIILSVLAVMLAGCTSSKQIQPNAAQLTPTVVNTKQLSANPYPVVEKEQLEVQSGTQTITVANALADRLGVEYIEWSPSLNPYSYKQTRNQLITLDYRNPQNSFLELFSNSGLLALYDNIDRTVTIHPYSLQDSDSINKPFVFTPMFDRSIEERKQVLAMQKERLSKQWLKYHYYRGYTIQETVNAWAANASIKSVVWFLQSDAEVAFVQSTLPKDDYEIGKLPIDVIQKFLRSQLERQNSSLRITATLEKGTGRLVIHPLIKTESLKTFDMRSTSVKENMNRIAKIYDYKLDWKAVDYKVPTPYVTVLTSFVQRSISQAFQQYPYEIEVVDSTKIIKVRDGI